MNLTFLGRNRVRKAVRTYARTVSLSDFGIRPGSWLAELLAEKAETSQLRPAHMQELDLCLPMLKLLAPNLRWQRIIRKHRSDLQLEDILTTFEVIEDVLFDTSYADLRRYNTSVQLRRWVKDYAARANIATATFLRRMYRTKHRSNSAARPMISELVDEQSAMPEPIGTLSFSSVKDLKRLQSEKVASTLQRIELACTRELDKLVEARHQLSALVASLPRISDDLLDEYFCRLIDDNQRQQATWFSARPLEELVAATVLAHRDSELNRRALVRVARYEEVGGFLARALNLGPSPSPRVAHAIHFPELGTQSSVLACLILLQRHTGWNATAVLEIDSNRYDLEALPIMVQGFKWKTGEQTPAVEISSSDLLPLRALSFLHSRRKRAAEMGWLVENDSRLWINSYTFRTKPKEYQSWNAALKVFASTHGLPRFSLDQLRTEVLVEAMQGGGLDAAMHKASHVSISTTAHYFDQLMLKLTNSAITLEFEKRLEANVRFLLANARGQASNAALNRSIDMLYPIGDGASCVNPERPPDDQWLEGGMCGGRDCHVGEGCPNIRIDLDVDRLEELVRTERYYREEWRRLFEENPDEFAKYHLPAALFAVSLVSIVERSPYRSYLNRVRQGTRET